MTSKSEFDQDGDPSLYFGDPSRRKNDWKVRRLCRQVAEALQSGLAGECADDLLQQLYIQSVDPAPDASRLCIVVEAPDSVDPATAWAHLEKARSLLRGFVAAAIHRKKVPELVFRMAGPGEETP